MMTQSRRTPQGVRGLKPFSTTRMVPRGGRTPQGVRGLKLADYSGKVLCQLSHSARSAWIETKKIGD